MQGLTLASCWSWAEGLLGQCMEEGHHQGCSGGPCSSFCNGCMVPGQAEGGLYMQACNYSFLKDAIVHLNIKYGLWFQSEIFVGFYKTTTNKQSKQQQKSDTFQAGFCFLFLFLLQGDAGTCILWFSVQRKDISQMVYFFVHPLFTDFPKSFILKFFRRLGCNFLFNSVDILPQFPRCFYCLLQI